MTVESVAETPGVLCLSSIKKNVSKDKKHFEGYRDGMPKDSKGHNV